MGKFASDTTCKKIQIPTQSCKSIWNHFLQSDNTWPIYIYPIQLNWSSFRSAGFRRAGYSCPATPTSVFLPFSFISFLFFFLPSFPHKSLPSTSIFFMFINPTKSWIYNITKSWFYYITKFETRQIMIPLNYNYLANIFF